MFGLAAVGHPEWGIRRRRRRSLVCCWLIERERTKARRAQPPHRDCARDGLQEDKIWKVHELQGPRQQEIPAH